MILALALLAAAAQERVTLLDEVFEVPRSGWRAVDVALKQRPAIIDCRFSVVRGGSGVRVALLQREHLGRFRGGQPHRVLLSTGFESRGGFRHAPGLGDYSLLLDNRLEGRGPASVRLEVALEFGRGGQPLVRELSTGRRVVVILTSLAVFAAILWYASRRLRRVRGRP
jgi:hypothetical protein